MIGLLAWLLAVAGFAALGLAMERHHGQVFGRRLPPRRRVALRCGGGLLLGGSLALCTVFWGGAIGGVAWCGMLSAAALPVALALTVWPRAAGR